MVYGLSLHHYPTEAGLDEMSTVAHDLIGQTPVRWYRSDFYWDNARDAPHENNREFLDLAHARGVSVLFILDRWSFPDYALASEDAVRSHVRRILEQCPDADAWEIWNEPNITIFQVATAAEPRSNLMWGAPEDYVRFLRVCYEEIKRVSTAPVLSAGLSPGFTACGIEDLDPLCEHKYGSIWHFTYLDAVIAAGGMAYCDAVGCHVYGPVDANVYVVRAYGSTTGKPIWVTELGFPSCGGPTFSEELQADVLYENMVNLSPYAAVVFWYCMTDYATRPGVEACFGVLRTDFSPKPSYYALQSLPAAPVDYVPALLATAAVLTFGMFWTADIGIVLKELRL